MKINFGLMTQSYIYSKMSINFFSCGLFYNIVKKLFSNNQNIKWRKGYLLRSP